MTIRGLRIFLSVIDTDCNFTKTAELLNLTQPAISQAIRELEEHYSIKLFGKNGKRLVLTEGGKVFEAEARRVVEQDRCINYHRNLLSAILREGIPETIS